MSCPDGQTFSGVLPDGSRQHVCTQLLSGGFCCQRTFPMTRPVEWPCGSSCVQMHPDGWGRCVPCPEHALPSLDGFGDGFGVVGNLGPVWIDAPSIDAIDGDATTIDDLWNAFSANERTMLDNISPQPMQQLCPQRPACAAAGRRRATGKRQLRAPCDESSSPDMSTHLVTTDKKFILFDRGLKTLFVEEGRKKKTTWCEVAIKGNGDCFFIAVALALNTHPHRVAGGANEGRYPIITVAALRDIIANRVTDDNWRALRDQYSTDVDINYTLYSSTTCAEELRAVLRSKRHYAVHEDIVHLSKNMPIVPVRMLIVNRLYAGADDENDDVGGYAVNCFEKVPHESKETTYIVILHDRSESHFTLAVDKRQDTTLPLVWTRKKLPDTNANGIKAMYFWDELPKALQTKYRDVCGTAYGVDDVDEVGGDDEVELC